MKIVKTYKEKQIQIEYLINEKQTGFKQTGFSAKIILRNISYNKSFTFYFNFNYLFVNIEKEDMKCYINDQRDYVAYYDKMDNICDCINNFLHENRKALMHKYGM